MARDIEERAKISYFKITSVNNNNNNKSKRSIFPKMKNIMLSSNLELKVNIDEALETNSNHFSNATNRILLNTNLALKNLKEGVAMKADNWRSVDYSHVTSLITDTRESLLEYFDFITKTFSKTKEAINDEDAKTILTQINNLYEKVKTPSLKIKEIKAITEMEPHIEDNMLAFKLSIPLVLKSNWHELFIAATPTGKFLPDFQPLTIVVDEDLKYFFKAEKKERINSNTIITANNEVIITSIKEAGNCAIEVLAHNHHKCKYTELPEDYDKWTITPVPNTFIYHTSSKFNIFCNTINRRLNSKGGVTEIEPGCEIRTATKIIKAAAKSSINSKKYFKLEGDFPTKENEATKQTDTLLILSITSISTTLFNLIITLSFFISKLLRKKNMNEVLVLKKETVN